MLVEKKENFTLISFTENSFSNSYNAFLIEEKKHKEENLVLQISNKINIANKDFLLFLEIAEQKKENGTSFVIINSNIDVDNFPDHFNIVPTLQEAKDVIEMEAIEKELGF